MMMGSKANHVFSESVAIAAQKGMEECRHQFTWEKWNCPKSAFNVFSKSNRQPATKEMAFLHAVLSAAIVITLTRNCSLGHFDACSCDDTKKGAVGYNGWTWGGCSDDVRFGNKMAKQFLDGKEAAKDAKALINLHNNKVGRTLVRKSMRRMCKCHGVSGSCATQTCWMRLPDMRHLGNILKDAYKTSVRVEFNDHGSLFPSKHRRQRTRNALPKVRAPRNSLIHIETSPDYCLANVTAGVHGTRGRQCSKRKDTDASEAEKISCKNLCRNCGLKVRQKIVQTVSSCRCKFLWCCHVKCDDCKNRVLQHVCY